MTEQTLPRRPYPSRECTASPIFLLQTKHYHYDSKCWDWFDEDCETMTNPETGKEPTNEELVGRELAQAYWRTERVFFTREEATKWAEARHYRWRDGWQVYCIPSEGELSKILAAQTDAETNDA